MTIAPAMRTLSRRAKELRAAAGREVTHDLDSAALLMFYAAECGLKAAHMQKHNLHTTAEARGYAGAARDYGHRIDRLVADLRIPASKIGAPPKVVVRSTGNSIAIDRLHEAWRYGEKIESSGEIYKWLSALVRWAEEVL